MGLKCGATQVSHRTCLTVAIAVLECSQEMRRSANLQLHQLNLDELLEKNCHELGHDWTMLFLMRASA